MTDGTIPQVDHLLLLVGGNPLPNAVAGRLLVQPGGTVSLLYSQQTMTIKDRLAKWLQRAITPQPIIREKKVEEANPFSIYQGVMAEVKAVNAPTAHLHYTGGTKAMSVYAYLAGKHWAEQKSSVKFQASYLDSHTLSLVFDPADPASGQKPKTTYVGLTHSFNLVEDLLALHGWELLCPVNQRPVLPLTTAALVDIHTNYSKTSEWYHWLKGPNREWKTEPRPPVDLPTHAQLVAVTQALHQELELENSQLHPSKAAHLFTPCPEKRKPNGEIETPEELFLRWLGGGWLENYVLQVLQAANLGLRVYQGVETKSPRFEVDIAAIHGYQLFLFSCTTLTDNGARGRLKLKLLEASVRAAQLGGDEARVALVCCADDAGGLQSEMRLILESERIRVFGRQHLANLGDSLARWIRAESKERP